MAEDDRLFSPTPEPEFQAIQFKWVEMYLKIETPRLLTWKAAYPENSSSAFKNTNL